MIYSLPTGTVTFLFTDIEGSTKLAQGHPDAWESLRKRHDVILQTAITAHNGYIFQIIGDSFCASFSSAGDAIQAAAKSQADLQENNGNLLIKVRMGIHTGKADILESGGYRGYITLSRVQRLMSAGHGGQTLISQATQELIRDEIPEGVSLRDLGERRLKDLIRPEHIHQLIIPNLPADFPPLKTLDIYRHNLPAQTSSFIGREKEIAEIKEALEKHRLVTLTGSGGTGKTRLSLQVAAELIEQYPDGVWFIELAPLTDPDLIPQTILSALGTSEQQGKSALQSLTDHIHDKNMLFILDNCEHLIESCAKLADILLSNSQALKILASSREALGVKGEMVWHVPSLSMPDIKQLPTIEQLSQYEAVRLFIERASLAQQHFTVTKDNAPAIAQICFRLDGIPLAIELAATRVNILKAEQIAERLNDRFRLLTGGSRTALPRQQTLRAMIDWSYDLLVEKEKLLLRRLAVFIGGWTLELAEQVCSDEKIDSVEVLDMLGKLADKSLVLVNEDGAETRYRVLETVRQYAREKLFESGEGEKTRDQHLKAFIDLAEKAEPEIRGANQLIWLDRLEDEIDNLRAALEWSRERDQESCLRLASGLWRFWDLRSYNTDADEWFAQSIILSNSLKTVSRARLLSRASAFYRNANEEKKMLQFAREASTLARELNDKPSLALALGIEGEAFLNQPLLAQPLLEEALKISEELGDHWLACTKWYALAELANRENDHELQRSRIEKGLEEARLSKDHRRISVGLGYLSFYYIDRGKFSQAEEILSEGLALARQIGDKDNVAERSMNLANAYIFLERYSEAEALLIESRKTYENIGYNSYLVGAICGLSYLAWVRDDIAQFTELCSEALRIARQVDSSYGFANISIHHGSAALLNHEYQLAREEFTETLHACQKMNVNWYYGWGIVGFGMLALAEGQLERAAQIFGAYQQLAPSLPAETPFLVRKIHEEIAAVRSKLGNESFEIAAQRGKIMTLEEILAFVLEE